MKKRLLLCALWLAALHGAAQITTRIEGTVELGPLNGTLLLGEYDQDFRVRPPVEIAYTNWHFSHEWEAADTMLYTLCFKDEYEEGSWKEYWLFSEGSTLRLTLTPGASGWTRVEGGALTQRLHALYAPVFALYRQEEALENATPLDTAALRSLEAQIEQAHRQMAAREKELMAEDGGAVGLYLTLKTLRGELQGRGENPAPQEETLRTFERYAAAMPTHPLTIQGQMLVDAWRMVRDKTPIPALTVRDLAGQVHSVQSLLKARYTLLDLWASWCGPCRQKAKAIIPLYERYRDQGFDVVAIARESGDTAAMQAAMRRDGYPWTSYVDLGDEFGVWQRMGIGNQGGAQYLLDATGRILLTDPTPEEVERVLRGE